MLNNKKILVCNCAGLGDAIMFTPTLRKIKQQYPKCTISFITKPVNRDSLAGLPYIDHVYTLERKNILDKLKIIPKLIQQDYVIFTDWQPQLATIAYWLKVPHISGITRPNHRSEKLFERHIKEWVLSTAKYAADVVNDGISLALGIDIKANTEELDVALPGSADVSIVDTLLNLVGINQGDAYICIAPFTGALERNWSIAYVKELIELNNKNYGIPIVIVGGPKDYPDSASLDKGNLVGKTTLLQMIEIIKRAKLFIGPDSGPVHIAAAVKTPSIALFSKDIPSRWAPKKNCKVISLNLLCSPCGDEVARKCPTLQCNRGITSDIVFQAVKEELYSIK